MEAFGRSQSLAAVLTVVPSGKEGLAEILRKAEFAVKYRIKLNIRRVVP